MRKTYSAEFKTKVVREVLREDKTLSQIASAHGLHPNLVAQWRDQALAGLPGLFSRKAEHDQAAKDAATEQQMNELYAEIGKLSTQLAWLKKKLVISLSRTERMNMLEWEGGDMPIKTQADLLSLNRSSLYYVPVGVSPETVALRRRIDEIYTAHPYYGVRRITVQLRRDGLLVNHKAVARHMREMGIAAIYPGPNLSQRQQDTTVYPYLLRHVTASYPNHVWGIDITYIRLVAGWLYLVAVLDRYSRYVVSWELDQTLEISFVLAATRAALSQATPVIWNSDQGSHFTSPQYTDLLRDAEVQISMDGRGRALDNVFTERLWRTVKYEEVYLHDYTNPREARTGLSRHFDFYNRERPHQALDYQTPADIYFQKGVSSTDKSVIFVS